MPKYEYACRSCGEHLEVVQSFTDDALSECPACGGPLRKVFGNIGVVLKGSGFYKTDNRSTTDRRKSSSDSGDGAKSDKADSKSGDSKSGDSKGGDSKGDSKSSDGSSTKSSESKSGESKAPSPKADTTAKSA